MQTVNDLLNELLNMAAHLDNADASGWKDEVTIKIGPLKLAMSSGPDKTYGYFISGWFDPTKMYEPTKNAEEGTEDDLPFC